MAPSAVVLVGSDIKGEGCVSCHPETDNGSYADEDHLNDAHHQPRAFGAKVRESRMVWIISAADSTGTM